MAADGFPVVIVNPTRVYGPGNLTEGNSATRLIDQYDRGLMPFLLNRGRNVGNWVLVDDVVEGHLLAMEHGRIGQRYLLGGENASLADFFRGVDQATGKRHFKLPHAYRHSADVRMDAAKASGVVRHLSDRHARLGADVRRRLGL